MGYDYGRGLEPPELKLISQVFGNTLPDAFLRQKVMIKNITGISNRPYTSIEAGIGRYNLNIGDSAFDSRKSTQGYLSILVHEMTHVWQAHTSFWGIAGVWASSITCQIAHGSDGAYWYGDGNVAMHKDWDSYGDEQQAQIVQDWYLNNMKSADPRFYYIRNNIRQGQTGYVSDTPTNSA